MVRGRSLKNDRGLSLSSRGSLRLRLFRAYRLVVALAIATLCLPATVSPGSAATDLSSRLVSIGTGSKGGVYYLAGGAMCDLVNADRFEHGLRCLALSTDGSIANLRALRRGTLDLALVQSDLQYQAYRGTGAFEESGHDANLRAVFSLYTEPFTVLARSESFIDSFDDLKGKRVNVGNPGSGQRSTMESVMAILGWTMEDFGVAAELGLDAAAKALCDGDVDAAVFTVGHPDQAIAQAIKACGAVLVPLSRDLIDKVVAANPSYRRAIIAGGTYASNADDVPTFGVVATLVTSAQIEPRIVTQVVRSVFDNFDAFRAMHPVLKNLNRAEMTRVGLTAPLQAGAVRYFREAGLLSH